MISLSEIKRKIEGPSEDARFVAWMELYSSSEGVAKETLKEIIYQKDPVLKVLLCRFLGNVNEERAVQYLLELLQDENEIVVDRAKKNFEKNRYDGKLKKLVPLIYADRPLAKYFAIEKVSEALFWEVLTPLITMLPGANEALLLKLLTAFRYLPHKKIIHEITQFLKDTREEVRFKTVLALGSAYEAGFSSVRKYLIPMLSDKEARIRQAVLWTLRRSPSRHDLQILFDVSIKDEDSNVRQESLLEFALFPTTEVMEHLLNLLVFDKDKMVTLKAEAILLSMPVEPLIAGLQKAIRLKNPQIRNRAILFFAHFQRGSKKFFPYLVAQFKKAPNDKEKIPLIEALGIFESRGAIPLLENCLHAAPLLAYTAMNALLKILKNQDAQYIVQYLKDPELPPLLKQMVLKNLMRQWTKDMFDDAVLDILIQFLDNPNLNIRYLSARALVTSESSKVVSPLLKTFLLETDPQAKEFLRESVVKLSANNPDLFLEMLQQYQNEAVVFHLLLSILKEIRFSGKQILSLIDPLFGEPQSLFCSDYKDICADFLFLAILQERVTFGAVLEKMKNIRGKENFLSFVASELKKRATYTLSMPVESFEEWIDLKNRCQTESIIDLLGLSHSPKAVSLLVSVACDAAMKKYHARVSDALKNLIRTAA